MELIEIVNAIPDFDEVQPREKIKLFAWFLHVYRDLEILDNASIRSCFTELHLRSPNIALYTQRMLTYGEFLKIRGGFKLARNPRQELDFKYRSPNNLEKISAILLDLPAKIPNINERVFLEESLRCYQARAFRSCIIMIWNLTYAHLLDWILIDSNRLNMFNTNISKRYPKLHLVSIKKYDDFIEEFKEFQVIDICNTAGLLNSNISKILKQKLERRNICAHPSSEIVVQSQADDAVTDLINNVVLSLI